MQKSETAFDNGSRQPKSQTNSDDLPKRGRMAALWKEKVVIVKNDRSERLAQAAEPLLELM